MKIGHGEKLSRKAEALIGALLSQPSIVTAAASVGVSDRTARAWLKESAFVTAYRDARRQAVDQAVALLQRASVAAVGTLVRNLTNPDATPADTNKAAALILANAIRGVELTDVVERLERLEARDDRKQRRFAS